MPNIIAPGATRKGIEEDAPGEPRRTPEAPSERLKSGHAPPAEKEVRYGSELQTLIIEQIHNNTLLVEDLYLNPSSIATPVQQIMEAALERKWTTSMSAK